jgi:hypothetical protein
MSARDLRPRRWVTAWLATLPLIAATAAIAAGCSTTPASASTDPVPASAAPSPSTVAWIQPPTPIASIAVTAATASAPSVRSDAPPTASMQAEGGDPVAGQLGSYTWGDGGSDSPWLPGGPITVAAGEPLTVVLAGDAVVADWTAARVAPERTDGASAVPIASADGDPIRFPAPRAGRWSVQVQVRFPGGSDSAAYYWLLDVR